MKKFLQDGWCSTWATARMTPLQILWASLAHCCLPKKWMQKHLLQYGNKQMSHWRHRELYCATTQSVIMKSNTIVPGQTSDQYKFYKSLNAELKQNGQHYPNKNSSILPNTDPALALKHRSINIMDDTKTKITNIISARILWSHYYMPSYSQQSKYTL